MSETRWRLESDSSDRTEAIAAAVAACLREGDVVLLEGDLGAGKTCFVRGLAQGLGLDPSAVSSPSFVIAQRYHSDRRSLLHVDAYRVEGATSLAGIDLAEMLEEPGTVAAIEWPAQLGPLVPERAIVVRLRAADESRRTIELEDRRGDASASARLGEAMTALFGARAVEHVESICPICKTALAADAPRPFCSSRCRLADLERWFSGRYVVSRPLEPDEEPLG
jgi:tRNA threonylcarbamoyladenosine biosynthesis protein TsaE